MNFLIATVKKIGALPIIFFISLLMAGTFHEFVACVLTVVLAVTLCYVLVRDKQLYINLNITTISVVLISLFYALSIIWAVDRGMAFIGFLKYSL